MPRRAFIDADLILRFLTDDVPAQADAVERLLDEAEAGRLELVTSVLVLAEVVQALEHTYRRPRPEVRDKMLAILNTPGIHVQNPDLVLQAVLWYGEGGGTFLDAYHAAWMPTQDLATVYTFAPEPFTAFDHVTAAIPE